MNSWTPHNPPPMSTAQPSSSPPAPNIEQPSTLYHSQYDAAPHSALYSSGEQALSAPNVDEQATDGYAGPSSYRSSGYFIHPEDTRLMPVPSGVPLAQNEPAPHPYHTQARGPTRSHVQSKRTETRSGAQPYAVSHASGSHTADDVSTTSSTYLGRMHSSRTRRLNNRGLDISVPHFIRTSNLAHSSSSLSPTKSSGRESSTPYSASSVSPSYRAPAWNNPSGYHVGGYSSNSSPTQSNIPSTSTNYLINTGSVDFTRLTSMPVSSGSDYSPSSPYTGDTRNTDSAPSFYSPSIHSQPSPVHHADFAQQTYPSSVPQPPNVVAAPVPRYPTSYREAPLTVGNNTSSATQSYVPSVPESTYKGWVASEHQVEVLPYMNDLGSATHASTPLEGGVAGITNNQFSSPVYHAPESQSSPTTHETNTYIAPSATLDWNFDLLSDSGGLTNLLSSSSNPPNSDLSYYQQELVPTVPSHHPTYQVQQPAYPTGPQQGHLANPLPTMAPYSSASGAQMGSTNPNALTGMPSTINTVHHEIGPLYPHEPTLSDHEQENFQPHDPSGSSDHYASYYYNQA